MIEEPAQEYTLPAYLLENRTKVQPHVMNLAEQLLVSCLFLFGVSIELLFGDIDEWCRGMRQEFGPQEVWDE